MNDAETLNEFFIWEEKNLIDRKMSSLKNAEQDNSVTTRETKNELMPVDWRDITDPKLRKKMRNKAWRQANKNKIKAYNDSNKDKRKVYYETNKEKIKIKKKAYRDSNKRKIKEQNKIYYQINKDKIKKRVKFYCKSNPEKTETRSKNYYKKNKNKILKRAKHYNQFNKEKKKEYDKIYRKNNKQKLNVYKTFHRKNNIQYKLSTVLRSRLYTAIKKNQKSGSAVKDLGCTIAEFKTYLESKFQSGMSWDNHGVHGWHIDHIKPLSSFDLTNREEFLQAVHYTNLQPLWAKDNLSKNDNYDTGLVL